MWLDGKLKLWASICFEHGLRVYHLINVDNLLSVYQASQAGQMEPNVAAIGILYNNG